MNYSRRQLEAFGEPLGESVTRREGGRIIYGGGGGGGGGGGTSTQVSDLPDWAKPYAQKTLAGAEALTFKKDAEGNVTGLQPYQQYGGECIALIDELDVERQRARLPEELEIWARKLIAFYDGCDEAGEQNMTSIYEPLQLLRDILAWHDRVWEQKGESNFIAALAGGKDHE